MKSSYKPFIYLGIAIIAVVGVIIFYNSQVKAPQIKVEEQSELIKELQQNQSRLTEMLRANKTISGESEQKGESGGINGWLLLLFISTVGLLIILYTRFVKPTREERNMEQIKEFYQGTANKNFSDGYAEKVLGFKVFELVKFFKGKYKGDHKFTLHLIVFTIKEWGTSINRHIMYNTEPPPSFLVGIFGSASDLREIKEIFRGISVDQMVREIHRTHQGVRMFYHEPVVTPNYEIDYKKTLAQASEIAAAQAAGTRAGLETYEEMYG